VNLDLWIIEARGRKQKHVDQDRYVKRLEMENDVLKKWLLEIYEEGDVPVKFRTVEELPKRHTVKELCSDRVQATWLYPSAIKDLYNNEIVGYHMSVRNDNPLVLQTFEKALKR
jgi:transposase InsO family protein